MPFSAKGGFFSSVDIPVSGYGNSGYWSGVDNTYLKVDSPPFELVNWKANTGYTIEYWIRVNSAPNWADDVANPGPGFNNATSTNNWSFGPTGNLKIGLFYWTGSRNNIQSSANAIVLNTWHYVAASFTDQGSGNTWVQVYLDGNRVADAVTSAPVYGNAGPYAFNFGKYGASRFWDCYVDNMRVSNTTRYTGNTMTIPTAPFTTDSNTLLYITMDGANGSTVFTDATGGTTITNNANNVVISNTYANHS